MTRDCPTCGETMDSNSASGRDHKGRDVGVWWHRCPACETIVDEFENVETKRDQQHAKAKAEKVGRNV